jgi:hypothetical protein
MRRTLVVAIAGLTIAVAAAHAETIKLRCTVPSTPKSEAEDYVVNTDENTVTVILHDLHGNVLSSKNYPATIKPDAIEWTVETAGKLRWTQRYDRATKTLTSSNSNGDSFKESCKVTS